MQEVSPNKYPKKIPNAVVTIGTFDGVHLGHQKILNKLKERAEAINGISVVITFWPHPRTILDRDFKIKLLSTFEEKVRLLRKHEIHYLLKVPFDEKLASLSAEDFVKTYLIDLLKTQELILGFNHRFGRNKEGSIEFIKTHQPPFPFDLHEIHEQFYNHEKVSSNNIRKLVSEGNLDLANKMLGRPYSISGRVIHGNKIGASIGFATANIEISSQEKLLPKNGVYSVVVLYKEVEFLGMINVGPKPTFKQKEVSIEVHLFNFEGELYGEVLTIKLLQFIRSQQDFSSIEGLKLQLSKDKKMILAQY